MLTKQFPTEEALLQFAKEMANSISNGCLIYLYGPLGVGKTTFSRGFLQGLGFTGKVKSPTYTLVEPYEIAGRKIYHCDFYRINHPSELEELGIQEYLSPDAICLIEWPEKAANLLPKPDIACYFDFAGEGREVRIER